MASGLLECRQRVGVETSPSTTHLHDGRIVGELPQAAATERAIGLMMAGVPEAPAR